MDRWAWEQLSPWLRTRASLPVGALFCVLRTDTRTPCAPAGLRAQLRRTAVQAGVRRRFGPHQYADIRVMPMWRSETNDHDGGAGKRVGVNERWWPLSALGVAVS